MNKAIIMGRLGKDPELRATPGGQSVCNFSVATSSYSGKGDDRKELTEWHSVIVWGNQAEACGRYLSKGRQVLVEGRIQTSSWEDKDGNKRYKTEIVAHQVQFIGGGNDGGERPSRQPAPQSRPESSRSAPGTRERQSGAMADDDNSFPF